MSKILTSYPTSITQLYCVLHNVIINFNKSTNLKTLFRKNSVIRELCREVRKVKLSITQNKFMARNSLFYFFDKSNISIVQRFCGKWLFEVGL